MTLKSKAARVLSTSDGRKEWLDSICPLGKPCQWGDFFDQPRPTISFVDALESMSDEAVRAIFLKIKELT